MERQSVFMTTPSILPVKVLNPFFEVVAYLVHKSRIGSKRYFSREPAVIKVLILNNRLFGYSKVVMFEQLC